MPLDTQVRDLEQVVVGLGPGPFTGLRVGVVTAQVLGQVLGLELRGICSLDVVAAQFAAAHSAESSWLPPTPGVARCTGLAIARTAYDSESRECRSLVDVPRLAAIGPAADLYADQLHAVPGPRSMDPAVLATARCDAP